MKQPAPDRKFGDFVKFHRQALDLSRSELCAKAPPREDGSQGMSERWLMDVEDSKDIGNLQMDMLRRLAAALEMPLDRLLGDWRTASVYPKKRRASASLRLKGGVSARIRDHAAAAGMDPNEFLTQTLDWLDARYAAAPKRETTVGVVPPFWPPSRKQESSRDNL